NWRPIGSMNLSARMPVMHHRHQSQKKHDPLSMGRPWYMQIVDEQAFNGSLENRDHGHQHKPFVPFGSVDIGERKTNQHREQADIGQRTYCNVSARRSLTPFVQYPYRKPGNQDTKDHNRRGQRHANEPDRSMSSALA